ncbi:sulfatase-like hydrolase/transferase [Emcibacteraceae bacterium]|jgi:choline-sulfatase|nr:sulfatase-like hydrolase/transferase [Kordiimonadaceae bacterium]MDA9770244.1 sulfatase-like hydrolase/transferase [Emcibacteraceae bacterium]MDG1021897.1 sulfatase-like hydrolase/transferase [Emcibacteraceae bacterium]MDG1726701.1 sulfatase-like hydrolase/transferase [Emcibacteraceae bacterium]
MKVFINFTIFLIYCSVNTAIAEENWNIIAIVPDDHSQRAMGAYGDDQAVTPNFDKLASQGVRFSNAYAAAPVCSPSRAAFFSGKYPSQVGVNDFLMLNEKYADRGLDTSAVLWPEILKQNGYKTGLIGKWHLGEAEERHPTNRGFDYFVGYEQDSKAFDPILDKNGNVAEIKGHTSNIFVKHAKEFLSENKDNKFALTMTFREPQRPWYAVPQEDLDAVAHIDPIVPNMPGIDQEWLKKMTKNNYAAIHALDRAVGEVLDELDRLGLAENTIVIYVGDHGMLIGHHGYFGRGAVGAIAGDEVVGSENIANLFDEAIKIPMIIRWPGKIKQNIALEQPVSNTDIFPTILSMLNIETPDYVTPEGKDLTPLLKRDELSSSVPVFAQYNMENFGIAHLRMVRFEDWKLIKRFGLRANADLVDELYNVKNDPGELNNLINQNEHQTIREELESLLREWLLKIDDPVLH